MSILLEKVNYSYQGQGLLRSEALKDIDLLIEDGEFLALIGHTGSGKSTLAQHLNGLIKPDSGRVLIDGQDINEKGSPARALKFRVGLVFQYPEHQLFEETVYKDIAFGPKNMGLSEAEIDARVRAAMESVGLPFDEIKERSPFELSGGQMRRAALAGVLAMRPSVLVLDEPTAGLDPCARDYLLQDIKRLHEEGTTIVMISHSMDDVARLATRIAVLEKGRLVMQGSPQEIFGFEERLALMGLDVPQACRLSRMLIEAGLQIPECYLTETLADALEKALKGGSGSVA